MRDCENQNCTPNGRSYIYPNADPPGAYCGGCSVVSCKCGIEGTLISGDESVACATIAVTLAGS